MKKKIITIGGSLGSGKSSTARRLAELLGYQHFSTGDLFRAIAKERGVTIEQINKTAELEKEIDHRVDERVQQLGNDSEMVMDSRLAFHWIPDSFKVYLCLPPEAAAKRILSHIQAEGRESQHAETYEEVLEATLERKASESKRYMDLYQIDPADTSHYDLIVDTEHNDLNAVVDVVLTKYREWLGEGR